MASGQSRSSDFRHHINWKFCYESPIENKPELEVNRQRQKMPLNADLVTDQVDKRIEVLDEHQNVEGIIRSTFKM